MGNCTNKPKNDKKSENLTKVKISDKNGIIKSKTDSKDQIHIYLGELQRNKGISRSQQDFLRNYLGDHLYNKIGFKLEQEEKQQQQNQQQTDISMTSIKGY